MANKREKRLARQAFEREAFLEKKARQAENPNSFKRVVEDARVRPVKRVAEGERLRPGDQRMQWSHDQADTEGEWSWGARSCLGDDWDGDVQPFLIEYAGKTWLEIYSERTGGNSRRQKHIFYDIEQICEEAQYRLIELERDDVDCIFRFRLAGKKRLYGVQQMPWFYVLWWDPEHQIYPVETD
jgi:hypothetical protein